MIADYFLDCWTTFGAPLVFLVAVFAGACAVALCRAWLDAERECRSGNVAPDPPCEEHEPLTREEIEFWENCWRMEPMEGAA